MPSCFKTLFGLLGGQAVECEEEIIKLHKIENKIRKKLAKIG